MAYLRSTACKLCARVLSCTNLSVYTKGEQTGQHGLSWTLPYWLYTCWWIWDVCFFQQLHQYCHLAVQITTPERRYSGQHNAHLEDRPSTHYRLLTFVLHGQLLIQSNETDGHKPQPLPGNSRTGENNNIVHWQLFKIVTFKCLWSIGNEQSWLIYLQQHIVYISNTFTCSIKITLHALVKETVCAEKGCPTNFHSSTFSSNFRPTIRELGAKISESVLAGSSLCVGTTS